MKYLFFDLDGTLTESGEGIINSVQYALQKLGITEKDKDRLRAFIGPPLIESFQNDYGLDRKTADRAVAYYREYFHDRGIFENHLYPGVEQMLADAKKRGFCLAVASSKPEPYVRQILEHFRITSYFDEITGSTLEGNRLHKIEVIEETLRRLKLTGADKVYMVGDKAQDILGARQAGIPCVAVRYGYGTEEELVNAHPFRIVSTVSELQVLLGTL